GATSLIRHINRAGQLTGLFFTSALAVWCIGWGLIVSVAILMMLLWWYDVWTCSSVRSCVRVSWSLMTVQDDRRRWYTFVGFYCGAINEAWRIVIGRVIVVRWGRGVVDRRRWLTKFSLIASERERTTCPG